MNIVFSREHQSTFSCSITQVEVKLKEKNVGYLFVKDALFDERITTGRRVDLAMPVAHVYFLLENTIVFTQNFENTADNKVIIF